MLDHPGPPDRFDLEQWINFDAIQLLVHHASAAIAAIVIFALVARVALWLLPHGLVRKVVVIIDDIVLIGLLVFFAYEMFVYVWNRRPTLYRGNAAAAALGAIAACLPAPLERLLGGLARILEASW